MLISVVGVSGIGKTALVRALAARGGFAVGLETHAERPFQVRYARDPRFALANQVDFLLVRAGQERALRQELRPGLIDGGLDLDFHGFTRLFHQRGDLDADEFDLCRRLYLQIRAAQPGPDLFLRLTAPADVVARRLAGRDRINIVRADEAARLDEYIDQWLAQLEPERVLPVDVSQDDPGYAGLLPELLGRIKQRGIHFE